MNNDLCSKGQWWSFSIVIDTQYLYILGFVAGLCTQWSEERMGIYVLLNAIKLHKSFLLDMDDHKTI